MELKEYLKIIKKHRNLFLETIVVVIAVALGYFYLLPVRYDASLALNITRLGTQATSDYQYDDYYRLQADQLFGDTLVEWLKSPRLVSDVYAAAGIDSNSFNLGQLAKGMVAERRSAQLVDVTFSAATPEAAQKISSSIVKVIGENTAEMNRDQKESTWFEVMADAPVIAIYHPNYKIIFLAALLLGIFLGFWVVMIKHYLE